MKTNYLSPKIKYWRTRESDFHRRLDHFITPTFHTKYSWIWLWRRQDYWPLACIASVSVGFRCKELPLFLILALAPISRKIPFLALSLLPNPTETLATQVTWPLSSLIKWLFSLETWHFIREPNPINEHINIPNISKTLRNLKYNVFPRLFSLRHSYAFVRHLFSRRILVSVNSF